MTTSRGIRADAQRNREAILRAARETFETDGVLASLDGIAARAGVGNATLYRNFPTRDDLLAAVLQLNIDAALADAAELSEQHDAADALREWMIRLAWQLRIWHDLPYCVATAHADTSSPSTAEVCSPLLLQTGKLLDAARRAGAVADAVSADELYELVTTLSWGVDRFGDDEAAARRRVLLATTGIVAAPNRPSGAPDVTDPSRATPP